MPHPQEVQSALQSWSRGDRAAFREFFACHPDFLQTHPTPDAFDYLLPALFIRDFCCDLIDSGFPVEQLFSENLQDFGWTSWPRVMDYVKVRAPQLLIDLASDENLSPQVCSAFAHQPPQIQIKRLSLLPPALADQVIQEARRLDEEDAQASHDRRQAIRTAARDPQVLHAELVPSG